MADHLLRSVKTDGVGGKRDLFVSQLGIGIDPYGEGIFTHLLLDLRLSAVEDLFGVGGRLVLAQTADQRQHAYQADHSALCGRHLLHHGIEPSEVYLIARLFADINKEFAERSALISFIFIEEIISVDIRHGAILFGRLIGALHRLVHTELLRVVDILAFIIGRLCVFKISRELLELLEKRVGVVAVLLVVGRKLILRGLFTLENLPKGAVADLVSP